MLSVENYTESLVSLLITKLAEYSMSFGRLWMKKYGVLLNMINDFITFSPAFGMYLEVPLFSIVRKSIEVIKTIPEARQ